MKKIRREDLNQIELKQRGSFWEMKAVEDPAGRNIGITVLKGGDRPHYAITFSRGSLVDISADDYAALIGDELDLTDLTALYDSMLKIELNRRKLQQQEQSKKIWEEHPFLTDLKPMLQPRGFTVEHLTLKEWVDNKFRNGEGLQLTVFKDGISVDVAMKAIGSKYGDNPRGYWFTAGLSPCYYNPPVRLRKLENLPDRIDTLVKEQLQLNRVRRNAEVEQQEEVIKAKALLPDFLVEKQEGWKRTGRNSGHHYTYYTATSGEKEFRFSYSTDTMKIKADELTPDQVAQIAAIILGA